MARTFTAAPAVRQTVNLILGLVGPSSSGKTWSALELATGIQSVVGGDIDVIDTEHGRALFYAEHFRFNHVPFDAPFASLDYLAAIEQSAKRGAKVIVVDSMSHEHEGVGGMIDFQEREVERMAGNDYAKRERVKMLAWQKPKAARRKLLQGLTQIDAHVILCFRAKNTSKPAKDSQGKSTVVPMGFVPIAGEEFVFEAALSMLFHPNSGGVPTWDPELPGERIAVKLPKQFEWLRSHRGPINAQVGAKLAQWAVGSTASQSPGNAPQTAATSSRPSEPPTAGEGPDRAALTAEGHEAAARGGAALRAWWGRLSPADKAALKPLLDGTLKPAADRADTAALEQAAEHAGQVDEEPAY